MNSETQYSKSKRIYTNAYPDTSSRCGGNIFGIY